MSEYQQILLESTGIRRVVLEETRSWARCGGTCMPAAARVVDPNSETFAGKLDIAFAEGQRQRKEDVP